MNSGMWGVKFESAKNSLICGNAVFECFYQWEDASKPHIRKFRLDMQPDKWTLDEYNWRTDKWTTITYGRREIVMPVVESVLPKKKDYDRDWTWRDFMTALTFFGLGVENGKV
jgi:hypothetical protein